jgi:hypothetical protein
MRYFLAESETTEELSDLVSQFLFDGWVLYGSPIISRDGETFCQAMTMEEKE